MHRATLGLVTVALAVAACGPTPSASPSSVSPSASGSVSPSSPPPTASGSASSGPSADAPPRLSIEPVVESLDQPVDVTWRPDDPSTLFVVEQTGRIRIVRDGQLVERPFLDISGMVRAGGEQGLLGLAFLPSGEDGRFFVYYTDDGGQQVVASYDTNPDDRDVAAPGTATIWLRMDDRFGNHNGGSLVFGADGYLYIGTGDGGGAGDPLDSGRHLDTLLAKVLRIDVSGQPADGDPAYRIPPDNPFVSTNGARPEIWHTGLRNPWRIRFDRATGDLWIADVGQGDREEIDYVRRGAKARTPLNFGWNTYEGRERYPGGDRLLSRGRLVQPVTDYSHDLGCSVTGGYVYRGRTVKSAVGRYFYGDYCTGNIWSAKLSGAGATGLRKERFRIANVTSFGEDAAGELFAVSHGGTLYRLTP